MLAASLPASLLSTLICWNLSHFGVSNRSLVKQRTAKKSWPWQGCCDKKPHFLYNLHTPHWVLGPKSGNKASRRWFWSKQGARSKKRKSVGSWLVIQSYTKLPMQLQLCWQINTCCHGEMVIREKHMVVVMVVMMETWNKDPNLFPCKNYTEFNYSRKKGVWIHRSLKLIFSILF